MRSLLSPSLALILVTSLLTGTPLCAEESSDRALSGLSRAQDEAIPPQVESMYVKALDYLKGAQQKDGGFEGSYGDDPATAAFCLLSVLAHGEDPEVGPYATMVQRCLNLILNQQNNKTGFIGSTMYSHGFATLALAEAYGSVSNDRIAPALQKAIDLSLEAQKTNPFKAWRYQPTATDADTSVTGCIMVSLFAAKNAGIGVPDEAIENGLKYLASCRDAEGSYGYTSPGGQSLALSAIGSLTLSLAKERDDNSYNLTLELLGKKVQTRDSNYPFYFEYYMAQALFHGKEEYWRRWNANNIRLMSVSQSPNGSWQSSYSTGFTTAFALLSLAVNYRLLPIYEK
jgi:hypothetical protein